MTAKAKLQQANGAEPTVEEIAAACDMTAEKVTQLLELDPKIISIDTPTGDGEEGSLGDLLENIQAAQPYEELVRQELTETIEYLLTALNERQQQILRLHFGMVDGTCHSLEQISRDMGVSKERVRQIEQQAIATLQNLGSSMGLEDFLS
jgi:RNA polymerase primary sigma factor